MFQELDNDQRRELVNTQQRFEAFVAAQGRANGYRGSMVFSPTAGTDYLLRSYYDPVSGVRRQKSLGRRSPETERLKTEFDTGRAEAGERLAAARAAIERQAGVNRALGLGRVPELGARIIRGLDAAGLLGRGLRVVGTNALFAYEAAAGVRFAPEVTTTEDIDILFDARVSLRFAAEEAVGERTLLSVLRRADRSFERTERAYQARNRDGYLVDLIRPLRNPPWAGEASAVAGGDLEAVEIAGLAWQENAPAFSAVAIDVRGMPVRIAARDPRAFAIHKLWLADRPDRAPAKRARDRAQAKAVAALVATHLPQLAFDPADWKSFPRETVTAAAPLFEASDGPAFTW